MIHCSVDTRVIQRGADKNPSTLNVIPATSRGCSRIGPCWDLGMIRAIIYISSEHNVSKNNKNKLFSTVLSWFNLAVTLRWPWHNFWRAPLWNPAPTHVTMCNLLGLGSDRFIGNAGPKLFFKYFWTNSFPLTVCIWHIHIRVKKIYGLQKSTGGGVYRWAQDLTGQQVHDGTPPSEYDGS